MNQLVADLKAARKLIKHQDDWAKGKESFDRARDGEVNGICGAGAIYITTEASSFNEIETNGDRYDLAWRALSDCIPASPDFEDKYGRMSLPLFNDAPETTHADILALFDRAIARAEQP